MTCAPFPGFAAVPGFGGFTSSPTDDGGGLSAMFFWPYGSPAHFAHAQQVQLEAWMAWQRQWFSLWEDVLGAWLAQAPKAAGAQPG